LDEPLDESSYEETMKTHNKFIQEVKKIVYEHANRLFDRQKYKDA